MSKLLGMLVMVMVLSVMALCATAQPAAAQAAPQPTVGTGEYMNVSHLTPFSEEANFMSLAGYLRWSVLRDQQVLLTRAEADRIVASQMT